MNKQISKVLLFLALIFVPMVLPAAKLMQRRVPALNFANLDRNCIEFPGGEGREMKLFFSKFDSLVHSGHNNVRIMHIAGSHVQGGVWTQQFRRNLLSIRYGLDGGYGMVFPFSAAGTNTPQGYTTAYMGNWEYSRCLTPNPDHPLGLSGIEVSTKDPKASLFVSLAERNPREWATWFTFKSVDVLGYASESDISPKLVFGRDTLSGTHISEKHLWHFDLPYFKSEVEIIFNGFPGEFTLTGIYLDRPTPGISVTGIGVNGAATSSYLKCQDFQTDLELVRPDLVFFCIGVNDIQGNNFDMEEYISNYDALIKQFKAVNPDCAFIFTSNNDTFRHGIPNRFSDDVETACRRLAAKYKCGFWNLYDIMGGRGSAQMWNEAGLMQKDKVHFTPAGYELVGNLMYNAFITAFENSVK